MFIFYVRHGNGESQGSFVFFGQIICCVGSNPNLN